MAVSKDVGSGQSLADLHKAFIVSSLFSKTGRFSFYGPPTDIKVKEGDIASKNGNDYKTFDVSFATLSQSTQTEIPRKATVVATMIPSSSQVVLLVASASALRWKSKGADKTIATVMDSFSAIPAPTNGLKVRAKDTSRYVVDE